MPTVAVRNTQGGEVDRMDLADNVFGASINTHCVRAAVNAQLAHQRHGTVGSRNRALIRGGGAKPWRQKGTGRARAGSVRSPLWRGGATIFGPQARSYGGRVNKRVRRSAICSCLTSFATNDSLVVVDNIELPEPKTRRVLDMLAGLGIESDRILIIAEGTNKNLILSARNLPFVNVISVDNLNVYDLTRHETVVATSGAIQRIQEMYA